MKNLDLFRIKSIGNIRQNVFLITSVSRCVVEIELTVVNSLTFSSLYVIPVKYEGRNAAFYRHVKCCILEQSLHEKSLFSA